MKAPLRAAVALVAFHPYEFTTDAGRRVWLDDREQREERLATCPTLCSDRPRTAPWPANLRHRLAVRAGLDEVVHTARCEVCGLLRMRCPGCVSAASSGPSRFFAAVSAPRDSMQESRFSSHAFAWSTETKRDGDLHLHDLRLGRVQESNPSAKPLRGRADRGAEEAFRPGSCLTMKVPPDVGVLSTFRVEVGVCKTRVPVSAEWPAAADRALYEVDGDRAVGQRVVLVQLAGSPAQREDARSSWRGTWKVDRSHCGAAGGRSLCIPRAERAAIRRVAARSLSAIGEPWSDSLMRIDAAGVGGEAGNCYTTLCSILSPRRALARSRRHCSPF